MSFSLAVAYVLRVAVPDGNASITSEVSINVNPTVVADTTGPILNVSASIIKESVSDVSGLASLAVNGTSVTVNAEGT